MARAEHWDRDRYVYERDRLPSGGERRERIESHDHHYRGLGGSRVRDHSDERYDRRPRAYDDDLYVHDRRYYNDEPSRLERRGYGRETVLEKDRSHEVVREVSPAPLRRPGVMRRQSSLDTYDRRPLHFYEREQYGPPARRDDYRPPPEPYVPAPLPRTRALPPLRRADDRYYEDIRVADPDIYGDDEFRPYPERVREKEVVRTSTRRRNRSPDSVTSRSYTRTSRSSSVSSRSSSRGRTTVHSTYPKKGKTKIPSRLVSKRALIDLGYPFIEEGNSIIILKALGQDNINEVLRVSEEYKKSDADTLAARSSAGNILEERRDEVFVRPPPPPPGVMPPPPPPGTTTVIGGSPRPAAVPGEVEVVKKEVVIRDVSPSRYSTTTGTTTTTATSMTSVPPPILSSGPLVHRPRSVSRSGRRELRAEIRALEAELAARRHSRGRGGDFVHAERLSDGQLVMYEERVEKVDEGHRGPRIEKDRKGRMSISVPKHR